MGVRTTSGDPVVALYDSVSGWAFGPTFETDEEVDSFLAFCEGRDERDIRALDDPTLGGYHAEWAKLRETSTPGSRAS